MDEHGRTFFPRSKPTSHPARQLRLWAELVDTINRYLSQHNLEPKRYVWHADGQEVLNKIRRAWASRHKSCHFGFIVCFRVNFSEVR